MSNMPSYLFCICLLLSTSLTIKNGEASTTGHTTSSSSTTSTTRGPSSSSTTSTTLGSSSSSTTSTTQGSSSTTSTPCTTTSTTEEKTKSTTPSTTEKETSSKTSTAKLSTKSTTKSTTPSTTRKNNIERENEKINLQIQHTLETSRTGHIIGNTEFEHQTAILRHAAGLDLNSLLLKMQAYYKFMNYNSLRLKLEGDLESRIAVIDSYLQASKIGMQCKAFYQNQKRELKSALNEYNALKSYKLKLYSEDCPHKESKDSSESKEEDSDWWCLFFPDWFSF